MNSLTSEISLCLQLDFLFKKIQEHDELIQHLFDVIKDLKGGKS